MDKMIKLVVVGVSIVSALIAVLAFYQIPKNIERNRELDKSAEAARLFEEWRLQSPNRVLPSEIKEICRSIIELHKDNKDIKDMLPALCL